MGQDRSALAAAHEYAWWLTGSASAASAAVRGVSAAGGGELTVLLAAVRRGIAGTALEPGAEVALLICRLGLPLDGVAAVLQVPADHAAGLLPRGLVAALVERPDVPPDAHDLPGLAAGTAPGANHAAACRPCRRARVIFEQARAEVTALEPPASDLPAVAPAMAAPHAATLPRTAALPRAVLAASLAPASVASAARSRPGRVARSHRLHGHQLAGASTSTANRRWSRLAVATGVAVCLALLPARPPAGERGDLPRDPTVASTAAALPAEPLPLPELDDLVPPRMPPPRAQPPA